MGDEQKSHHPGKFQAEQRNRPFWLLAVLRVSWHASRRIPSPLARSLLRIVPSLLSLLESVLCHCLGETQHQRSVQLIYFKGIEAKKYGAQNKH